MFIVYAMTTCNRVSSGFQFARALHHRSVDSQQIHRVRRKYFKWYKYRPSTLVYLSKEYSPEQQPNVHYQFIWKQRQLDA
jgi:hypothetical protein